MAALAAMAKVDAAAAAAALTGRTFCPALEADGWRRIDRFRSEAVGAAVLDGPG